MSEIVSKRYHAVAVAMLACCLAQAQPARRVERAGDDAFSRKDYYSAAKLYAAILYDSPLTALSNGRLYPFQARANSKVERVSDTRKNEVTFKLAEAYRMYNRPKDAALQYEKYIASRDVQHPVAQLWYGYTLIANNEPEKAVAAFNTYLKSSRGKDANAAKAREGIASANFIIASRKQTPKEEVTRIKATNPVDGSDFALEKINDSLFWFTTSRHELDKKGEKTYPIRLYTGNLNSTTAARPVLIPGELNVATPSLSADGLTMYFTGWKDQGRNGISPYRIYYMSRNAIDSPWHIPVDMGNEVNAGNYSSKQPYVTRDNRYLFFASDRPGGSGKFDIWMIALDGRAAMGKAIHPDSINTAGDDVTPFYDEAAAKLYFSSDGRIGMGGLDIYQADGAPATNQWTNITNMGAPVNSVRDDQYYRKDRNSETAYLSSDRASSCCLEIFRAATLKYTDTPATALVTKAEIREVVTPPPAKTETATDEQRNRRMLDSINAVTLERNYVHYDYASARIRKADWPQLDNVIKRMKADATLNIVVASFTDCNGTAAGNRRVAKQRSESVKAYLISRGISAERINTDFFARKHFVLPCLADKSFNKEAQMANRRSDLIVTRELSPKWRPLGNELDLAPSQISPLFRTANTNFDPKATIAANVKYTSTETVKPSSEGGRESAGNAKASGTAGSTGANSATTPAARNDKTGGSAYAATGKTAGNRATAAAPKENKAGGSSYGRRNVSTGSENPASKATRSVENETAVPQVKRNNTPPDILDINAMLDFTPRVKPGLIERMTKRIPRQPLYVYSTSDSVRVDLYDNGVFDSDSVSVIFNKQLVAYQRVLQTNTPVTFYVKLSSDPAKNEMIFFAENLGLTPPNSALMVITDSENRRTEVNVASDLEHNTVIYFIKAKK